MTIVTETVIPTSKTDWERTRTETDVLYFIKQIDKGGFFGLEELVEIGKLKSEGRDAKAKLVKRQLKVTSMSDCKLTYMTKSAFLNLFGWYELAILEEHATKVDQENIKARILANW